MWRPRPLVLHWCASSRSYQWLQCHYCSDHRWPPSRPPFFVLFRRFEDDNHNNKVSDLGATGQSLTWSLEKIREPASGLVCLWFLATPHWHQEVEPMPGQGPCAHQGPRGTEWAPLWTGIYETSLSSTSQSGQVLIRTVVDGCSHRWSNYLKAEWSINKAFRDYLIFSKVELLQSDQLVSVLSQDEQCCWKWVVFYIYRRNKCI